jgi:serine/threonine-protein kinase
VAAIVLLIVGGVFSVRALSKRHDSTASAPSTTAGAPAAAALKARIYRTDFGAASNVDVNSLPDPAKLAPRVVSPAEALHGRYLETTTYTNGQPQTQADYEVKTDCLRTGDRCMSRFHSPLSGFVPLVFEDGKWTSNVVGNGKCPYGGDLSQVKWTAEYPLPQPSQNPIQASPAAVTRNRPVRAPSIRTSTSRTSASAIDGMEATNHRTPH